MKPRRVLLPAILLAAVSVASAPTALSQAEAGRAEPPSAEANGGLLSVPPSSDPGVRKAGQLLQQMVNALGGAAYLHLRNLQQAGRTYSFYHDESEGAGEVFWRFWQWPDKERTELTKQRDWIVLYLGDKGYEITYKGVVPLEQADIEDHLRRRAHALPVVLREWLRQPGVALFYEGQAMAERKQAEQITVVNATDDSVTIAIDSYTHLPLKVAFTWRDPKTHDRTEEAEGYDNYRAVQGIMSPGSITRYRNGYTVNQRFITSTSYNLDFPATFFDASIAPPEKKKK